ncbi:MAG: hypothetical protein CME88_14850 [Hirschia sp.]|nr:hypothetical protein [Hirschia sp.]MBF19654.1 hypothetical protein [Hirschia sp.]
MKYETATLITIAALAAIATLVVACTEIIQVDERVTDAVIVDQIAEDNPVARSVSAETVEHNSATAQDNP